MRMLLLIKTILFLLYTYSPHANAQDFIDDLAEELQVDEIDANAQEEINAKERATPLEQADFSTIDEIEKLFKEKNILTIRKNTRTSRRIHKNLKEPRIIKGILKKNSIIYNFNDEHKPIKVPRNLLVNIWARVDSEQMVQLVGKSGKRTYQTKITNINSIQDDLDLPGTTSRSAQKYREWPAKNRLHSVDLHYTINTILKFHKESFRARYFDQLVSAETGDTITTANRFEFKTFYDSPYPWDFGLNTSYQIGKWTNKNSVINWQALYLGPVVNWHFVKSSEVIIQAQLSYQYAINFSASGALENYSFSANVFQFDIEGFFPTALGQLAGGLTFRSYKLAPQNETGSRPVTKDSFWSVGINFGLGIDFTI